MIESFSEGLLYFILYSMIGWVCETVFCSLLERRFVNRGFLRGPYCPIYGAGALAILLVSQPFLDSPLLVYLAAMAAATLLEYFTSWLMEQLFQIRWWDYSDRRFNLNGRVCPQFSLVFGVMGWAMAYFLHPGVENLVGRLPQSAQRLLSNALIFLFLMDLLSTLNQLLGFTQRLQKLQEELRELLESNRQHGWFDARDWEGSLARLRELSLQNPDNPHAAETLALLDSIAEKRAQGSRLLSAYPNMKPHRADLEEALESIRTRVWVRGEALWNRLWAAVKRFGALAARAGRRAAGKTVSRLSYYNLFWVFAVAGVTGYFVEMAYCLITTGGIESRQGMLYGPFNQVYGFGAVLMVVLLAPLSRKGGLRLFAGSVLVGGAYEVLCSLIQEKLFGSVSWQYEDDLFSIAGGRTSLVFVFFWGILGVWLIKGIYPWLMRNIRRIPRRQSAFLTAVLSVALAANMLLSGAAVHRWAARDRGALPANTWEEYLDREYPDSVMEEVYPNLTMRPGV